MERDDRDASRFGPMVGRKAPLTGADSNVQMNAANDSGLNSELTTLAPAGTLFGGTLLPDAGVANALAYPFSGLGDPNKDSHTFMARTEMADNNGIAAGTADDKPSSMASIMQNHAAQGWDWIPDLVDVPNTLLRKVPEKDVRAAELEGQYYHPIMRQLQIRPDQFDRFYNGVIRHIRNKHTEEIKRNTDASHRQLTTLVLRGFGYIIWTAGSEWTLDDNDLEPDEVRLTHVRGEGKENEENVRFFPIFKELWTRMRNVLFEPRPSARPAPRRRPAIDPTARRRRPDPRRTRTSTLTANDTTDTAAGADTSAPSSSFTPNPVNSSYYTADEVSAQSTGGPSQTYSTMAPPTTNPSGHGQGQASGGGASRRPATLEERVFSQVPAQLPRNMSAGETDDAIIDLIAMLARIRARSDPEVFAALWEQHIMRIDEYDAVEAQNAQDAMAEARATSAAQLGLTSGGKLPPNLPSPSSTRRQTPKDLTYTKPDFEDFTLFPDVDNNASTTGFQGTTPNSSQANEPWASSGNPVPPTHAQRAALTPIRPAIMSIYITVQHIATPVLLPVDINAVFRPTAAATTDLSRQAYHWPDAPVEPDRIVQFFIGINRRIEDMTPKILGYVFSYGWNDSIRFVSTGRLELRNLDDFVKVENEETNIKDGNKAGNNDKGGNTNTDDGNTNGGNGNGNGGGKNKKKKNKKKNKKNPPVPTTIPQEDDDFHLDQYRFLTIGWQQLQDDLDHAARQGVRVYRMKVGVVALAPVV
ncbi:hypothetical protein ABEF92_004005 [Exophiala dermatitidis]|uniref:Uncharacterized protein n=1 Tax=Exophiala dermatitidis (strain ATCC 34100 / CBS 525.76 / NIH/UT8656) TaxID=858893 RepID=H6CB60_EXODN|nr:uncharacterized protein HMPREF1120_08947 [Exophiala dermatitidis NIH/UT8656]EHY61007.1 hypothetical protein HMPREF1120_08947 [Exophiala dermatitidis NIH/UT8656]